jgi:dethiobiotin synthetase
MKKIIFVTGTDTGVGKTLVTAMLLFHLRKTGIHALAMKPFCSGGRGDVRRLQALQKGELSDDEMNPFYFAQPLAPFVAAGKKGDQIHLSDVVERISKVSQKCECLLVEGAGGLLVPLGSAFTIADLIGAFDCKVIITGRNRLGTINHTLLTARALQSAGIARKKMVVALMSMRKPDVSAQTNPKILTNLLRPMRVLSFPFLGASAVLEAKIRENYLKARSTLAKLAGPDYI